MGRNYVPEVSRMLGVKISEKFDILCNDGTVACYGPYRFLEDRLVNFENKEVSSGTLYRLLTGFSTIQKRPWIPSQGCKYWIVSTSGVVDWYIFDYNNVNDISLLAMGNCFETEETAIRNKELILSKINEIKKEYMIDG